MNWMLFMVSIEWIQMSSWNPSDIWMKSKFFCGLRAQHFFNGLQSSAQVVIIPVFPRIVLLVWIIGWLLIIQMQNWVIMQHVLRTALPMSDLSFNLRATDFLSMKSSFCLSLTFETQIWSSIHSLILNKSLIFVWNWFLNW